MKAQKAKASPRPPLRGKKTWNEKLEEITPYWRTLKAKGELNPKYPGGIDGLAKRLQAEGHVIFQKGKRFFVQDYEKALARM